MTDLTKLRALCDKATPGPWRSEFGHVDSGSGPICHNLKWKPVDGNEYAAYQPDANFIAEARTALPDLIDEVERLRAALTWAFDRLSVDGGMTINEQRRTLQQIGMVLRGLPCAAARHGENDG